MTGYWTRVLASGLAPFLLFSLLGCPSPEEPSEDEEEVITPPDDDDDGGPDPDCETDYECDYSSGLEICSDEGFCIQGDRNNSISEAQLIDPNSTANLVLAPAGDVDWFFFFGEPGDLVLLSADAEDPKLLDTFIAFTDSSGQVLAFNDDFNRVASVAPNSRLYTGVRSQGLWYFSVQDRRTWANDPAAPPSGGVDHRYTAGLTTADPDNYVTIASTEDDSPEEAVPWDVLETYVNYTAGGVLETLGDEDWFAVPVTAGEALRLYGFPNSGSLGSIAVDVLLPDGETVLGTWTDLTWATSDRAWIPILEDGVHYLRVREAAGLGGPGYWYYLHAAKNPADEGGIPEVEPNDDTESAESLELGEHKVWGRLSTTDDRDYFAVEGAEGDTLTLSAGGAGEAEPTAVLIEVRADTGTSIASGSWESGDDLVLSDLSLGSSTYFIEVAPASPDELEAAGNYYRLDIAHSRP